MSSAPIVDRIRIIPRPNDFLDRNVGASGEVFFNSATNSLRVYSGKDRSGFEIARADLDNIDNDAFTAKATAAGVGADGIDSIYTEDQSLDWAKGSYDFGNNIIKYANAVQLESELANYSPSTYHGMTMHVHETGALYYAHAGEWRKLLTDTSHNDAVSAGYTDPLGSAAYSNNYEDLDNLPTIPSDISDLSDDTNAILQSLTDLGISDGTVGQVLTTDGNGSFTFQDSVGGVSDAFSTVLSDDGTFNVGSDQTIPILGSTHISTEVVTDSGELTIKLDSFPIGFLSNVSSSSPTTGQVLKWDGSQWAPGTDIAEGGSGLDADTLDGFDGTYYLDYTNFTNTPSVATLTSFSIGNEPAASGDGAISYDNTTGVFRYTPPDLSSFLTSVAFADLTSKPTTIAGYGITDAFDGDYDNLTNAPDSILDFGISDGTVGQVLTTNGAGLFTFTTVSSGGAGASTFLELSDTPASFGTAGQIVAVNGTGDGLIFVNDQTGAGEANQNAFSNVAVSGQSTVSADTATDTLNISAGSGISITTDAGTDTVTITSTVSAGATAFTGLSDASSASLTIDKIYEPAIAMLRVTSSGTSAYLFNSHYSGNNPTIYALAGTTIAFDLGNIPGHPFEIQNPQGDPYNTNLVHVASNGTVSTGSAAQGKTSGTLYWRIPESISGNYRYQCQSHAPMVGTITVKRLSVI